MEKTIIAALLAAALLVLSGCVQEQPQQEEQETPVVIPEEEDSTPGTEETPPEEETPPLETGATKKMESPYPCDSPLLLSAMMEVFGQSAEVLRAPPPFGRTISYVSCNVRSQGAVVLQAEFHEMVQLQGALDSMEDEARQIENQLFGSEKTGNAIGVKGYTLYSQRNNETRILFVDNDGRNPVFVKVKTPPGTETSTAQAALATEKIEKLI